MDFRTWLEVVEGYRKQIEDAVIQFVRDRENMQEEPQDKIMNKSLKMWGREELKDLLTTANRKNFNVDRLKDIVRQIKSRETAEFTVQQVIDALDSNEQASSVNADKNKTYIPKPGQNVGLAPTPAETIPPAGPQGIPAPTAPMDMSQI